MGEGGLRVSLDNAPLGAQQNPLTQAHGHGSQPAVQCFNAGQLVHHAGQRENGSQCVHRQHAQQHPQCDAHHQGGHQPVNKQQQRGAPLYNGKAHQAPEQRGGKAHIAVQIPPVVGIIPPAGVGDGFQQMAGDPFHHRGVNGAAQKQKQPVAAQLPQQVNHHQAANAVYDAQRAEQHRTVYIAMGAHGGRNGLQQPAAEGEAEKQEYA